MIVILYLAIGNSLPFSFWIDLKEITYEDMCLGETRQFVRSTRTPLWSISAMTESQIIEFDGQRRIETDIFRTSEPIYQSGDYTEFWISWDEALDHPGSYGATTVININPLPFINSRTVVPAEERRFNVIECD